MTPSRQGPTPAPSFAVCLQELMVFFNDDANTATVPTLHANPRAARTPICWLPAASMVVGWFADRTERSVVPGASCLYIQRPLGAVSLTRRLSQSKSAGVHSTAEEAHGTKNRPQRAIPAEKERIIVAASVQYKKRERQSGVYPMRFIPRSTSFYKLPSTTHAGTRVRPDKSRRYQPSNSGPVETKRPKHDE